MTKATFVNFFYQLSSFIDWCYYTQVSYTGSWEPLVEMHDRPWCLDTVHVSFQRKTPHFNPFTINKGQRYNHENYQPITTSTCECCICYELLKQQLLSDPLWAFSNTSLSYPILHDFHLAYGTINDFFAILSIPFC